jgi:hypothetical protein
LAVTGSQTISSNLTVGGNLVAQQFIISSSVSYITTSFSSGSTRFGDTIDDRHVFTGSVTITGSLGVTGSVIATNFTGSLLGTSSFAVTSSFALNIDGGFY